MGVWVRDTELEEISPLDQYVDRNCTLLMTLKSRSVLCRSQKRISLMKASIQTCWRKHSLLLYNRNLCVVCLSSAEDMAWRASHRCAYYGVLGLQCIQHHWSSVWHYSLEVHQLPCPGDQSPLHHHEPA